MKLRLAFLKAPMLVLEPETEEEVNLLIDYLGPLTPLPAMFEPSSPPTLIAAAPGPVGIVMSKELVLRAGESWMKSAEPGNVPPLGPQGPNRKP
jgi:hypothetical protein